MQCANCYFSPCPTLFSAIKNTLQEFELFSTGLSEFIDDNLLSAINMPGSIQTKISMQKTPCHLLIIQIKTISFKHQI